MAKRSEDFRLSLMNTDSAANRDMNPGARHQNDTTTPLPVYEPSQYYNNEPAGVNSIIDSSQFTSYQNFQMDHNYLHRAEQHNFLPCTPNSSFPPSPEGFIGWPYDRHINLLMPADSSFNLNESGGMRVTPSYGLASRPLMVNPSGTAMNGNIVLPSLDMNLGMALCNPNQGVAQPLLTIGKRDERFMISDLALAGNHEALFGPLPSLHMPFQLPAAGDQNHYLGQINMDLGLGGVKDTSMEFTDEPLFGPPPNLRMPFQLPAAGDQNHYLGQINMDLGLGGVKDTSMEFMDEPLFGPIPNLRMPFQFTDEGDQNHYLGQFNMDLGLGGVKATSMEFTDEALFGPIPSLRIPSQFTDEGHLFSSPLAMATRSTRGQDLSSAQSWANGQLVPSSSGMVTDKVPTELLRKNNDKFSSQLFSSPLAMATRSTRGPDLSSIHGQSQTGGSIQQSNSLLRPQSTSGIEAGKVYMTAQVSRPSNMSSLKRAASNMSSLKRAASQPLASTVQNQHRKTLATQFIHPSVPNTSQAISPLVRAAQSLTPQVTHSAVPPSLPTTWTKSALQAPKTTRATSPGTNQSNHQVLSQVLARQHLKAPIMPSARRIASSYIKFKDQTLKPIGYQCHLCKRDLSYAPEGPISQPPVPPATAVLPCGHTFHDYCLEQITPNDQCKDPPCIPCALREN